AQVYKDLSPQESATLKDVYDKAVLELISKKENKKRLEEKFKHFNFDLLRIYPQPLIILLTTCPTALARLEKYLLNKINLTTFDRGLLVVLLCQSNFSNKKLFNKLQSNEQLRPIFEFIKHKKVIDDKNTGYYDIEFKKMTFLIKQVSFIEQIRQRIYFERQSHYSVSLNHLLNEIQLACSILDGKDIKTYKEPEVAVFLTSKGLNNPTKTKISNLFNRRNNNPVSHSGSDSRVAWAVEKTEYFDYKNHVKKTMETIVS
ncbi:MAG: AbiA family abortive infection protein, partial [Bacteroidales bacterium]|nr:AbiA family abortive infection protein [Bacteroidales bacterium]